MEYKDYYAILGLDRGADAKEIKKAYRKLARKHHPDVTSDSESSTQKFFDINEAHEVLSDPKKRKEYDQLGSQWKNHRQSGGKHENFNWNQGQSGGHESGSYRTVNPEDFEELFGTKGGSSSFFENLFGGNTKQQGSAGTGGQRFYQPPRSGRGQDMEHSVQVTLHEAFHGTRRSLEWEDGRRVDAKIPPGVKAGSRVRLKGQGETGIGGGPAGDLFLNITVLSDDRLRRDNDDLSTIVQVDLFTMLLGGKLSISGINRTVNLDIPPETSNGRVFRLKGLGMPKLKHPSEFGNLYVTVEAVLPQKLTAEEKDLVKQWQGIH